jgi:hypothetical protein
MLCCSPGFRPLLSAFDPASLERHAGAVMGLWPDDTLAYLNPAWYEFSVANGGEPAISERWDLGASVRAAIGRPLLPFYTTAFLTCRRTLSPWEHEYECSSADTFRKFHMKVLPLSPNGELLVVNSLVVERPHEDAVPSQRLDESAYRDERGNLSQCMHCRRFRRGNDRDRWDWIPEWVRERKHLTADALCPVCMDYYYPPESDRPG